MYNQKHRKSLIQVKYKLHQKKIKTRSSKGNLDVVDQIAQLVFKVNIKNKKGEEQGHPVGPRRAVHGSEMPPSARCWGQQWERQVGEVCGLICQIEVSVGPWRLVGQGWLGPGDKPDDPDEGEAPAITPPAANNKKKNQTNANKPKSYDRLKNG